MDLLSSGWYLHVLARHGVGAALREALPRTGASSIQHVLHGNLAHKKQRPPRTLQ